MVRLSRSSSIGGAGGGAVPAGRAARRIVQCEAYAPDVEAAALICRRRTDVTSRSASSGRTRCSPRSRGASLVPVGAVVPALPPSLAPAAPCSITAPGADGK